MAAPTVEASTVFSGAATGIVATQSGYTFTAGDVQLAFIYVNSGITITVPAGWTSLINEVNGSSREVVLGRVLAGGDSTTNIGFSASASAVYAKFIVRGADVAGYVDAVSADGSDTTSTSGVGESLTTTQADDLLLHFLVQVVTSGATTSTLTVPSGMTQVGYATGYASAARHGGLYSETIVSAGATGTRTSTSNKNAAWGSFTIVIKSATPPIDESRNGDMFFAMM